MNENYKMTAEERGLGHRSHTEWLQGGDMEVVYELFASDCEVHSRYIPDEMAHGIDAFKGYSSYLRGAFPDIQITDEDTIAEGDRVAIRWFFRGTHLGPFLGVPPTGKQVSMGGFDIFRVKDGKIQELWLENDFLTLMQQLGVAPGG